MVEPYSYILVCVAIALGIGWLTRYLIERKVERWRRDKADERSVGSRD